MIEGCPHANQACPYWDRPTPEQLEPAQEHGCFSDTHHNYFPENRYVSKLDKQFRDLQDNTEQLCRDDHEYLHETTLPPKKPTPLEMVAAIALARKINEA